MSPIIQFLYETKHHVEEREDALFEEFCFDYRRFDVDVPGGPVLQESKFTASGITYLFVVFFYVRVFLYLYIVWKSFMDLHFLFL